MDWSNLIQLTWDASVPLACTHCDLSLGHYFGRVRYLLADWLHHWKCFHSLFFNWSNISIHLWSFFQPPGKCRPNAHLLVALFWSPPSPKGNIWCFTVSPASCCLWSLPFGGQVVCCGFVRALLMTTAACCIRKQHWGEMRSWTRTVKLLPVKPKH